MKIKELLLYSSNLKKQAHFYHEILGLSIKEQNADEVSFIIGDSVLKIKYQENTTPYHFAINIPSNKIQEALGWLKEKTSILKSEENEVQIFDDWNAKSIYFYDEDQNIVELIARHNLKVISNEKFDGNLFYEISEIGVVTSDIEKNYQQLKSRVDLAIYDGGFERFCAVGDENGLFICIDKNKKDWFPTDDKAFSSPFKMTFLEKEQAYTIEYKNEEIKDT